MRPKKTFESVVEELIRGLRSGEITLDDPPPVKNTQVAMRSFRDAAVMSWHSDKALVQPLIPQDLSDVLAVVARVQKPIFHADVKYEVGNPQNRLWLFLGEGAKQSAENLWQSAAEAQARGIGDVRILVKDSKGAHELVLQLRSCGFTDNVRVSANVHVTGWLAFTDQTLFCHVRGLPHSEGNRLGITRYRPSRVEKLKRESIFRVQARSFPEVFYNVEKFYESLWQSGATQE